ncbi:MAG: 3',5'-cyclic-AMP phosphodiesterase [Halioglobus sp.]|nr:3',5'-cyclic-AMP phosphodiesterase [Halioglobus sp.]
MTSQQHSIAQVDVPGDVVRVVQLTDTHLCRDRGGTLLGMDTDHSLQMVIDRVLRECDDIDLLLCTGDLADNGAAQAYRRLGEYVARFDCDSFWLPGNHDVRSQMVAELPGGAYLCEEIRAANWQIVMLDSQIPGEVGGELGARELERLDLALQAAREEQLYSLVCLHHHPVPIDTRWLDEQVVADRAAFFEILDGYSGVRGVLWGHIHQEIDRPRDGVRLLGSPSTCVQFRPGSDTFRADDRPPGYRWLELHRDGRLRTGVSRVTDVAFTVDLESGGYL